MKTPLTFRSCGLNRTQNFLESPICPCGCGERANIILKTNKEVFDFIGAMLYENDCNHCAIFVVRNDGTMNFGIKLSEDDIQLYRCNDRNSKQVIADMQKAYKFHYYGLLQQTGDESYTIIMD